MAKQYGLVLPNKNKLDHKICPVSTAKPSIFDEDSDSDSPTTKPTGVSKGLKNQDKMNQEKAINEDPTVFQYDELYDDMEKKRSESKLARKDLERKPKYISKLMAAAERRKRENERRIERQVQKEREQEGDLYKEKESFITSAYKKKLEEMRELDEQEKYEEYLESIGDVRKQGNLDGFYRHLFDQKVNYEEKKDTDIKNEIKEEPNSDSESLNKPSDTAEASDLANKPALNVVNSGGSDKESNSDTESKPGSSRKRKHSDSELNTGIKLSLKKDIKQRKYRARRNSNDSNDENNSDENTTDKKEHLPSNLDADSDFSIDSSDSEEEKETEIKKPEDKNEGTKEESSETNGDIKKEETVKTEPSPQVVEEVKIEVEEKKPKIDIWKKRTVGEKYDEAVKRYFERKAQKEMLKST